MSRPQPRPDAPDRRSAPPAGRPGQQLGRGLGNGGLGGQRGGGNSHPPIIRPARRERRPWRPNPPPGRSDRPGTARNQGNPVWPATDHLPIAQCSVLIRRSPAPAGSLRGARRRCPGGAAADRQLLPRFGQHPLLHLPPHRGQEVVDRGAQAAAEQHQPRAQHIQQGSEALAEPLAIALPHLQRLRIAGGGQAGQLDRIKGTQPRQTSDAAELLEGAPVAGGAGRASGSTPIRPSSAPAPSRLVNSPR